MEVKRNDRVSRSKKQVDHIKFVLLRRPGGYTGLGWQLRVKLLLHTNSTKHGGGGGERKITACSVTFSRRRRPFLLLSLYLKKDSHSVHNQRESVYS
jgi:hypothetical protein